MARHNRDPWKSSAGFPTKQQSCRGMFFQIWQGHHEAPNLQNETWDKNGKNDEKALFLFGASLKNKSVWDDAFHGIYHLDRPTVDHDTLVKVQRPSNPSLRISRQIAPFEFDIAMVDLRGEVHLTNPHRFCSFPEKLWAKRREKSPFSRPWAAWRDSLKGNWCSRRTHHRCTRYRVAPWWMPGELGEKNLDFFRIFVGQQQKSRVRRKKINLWYQPRACDLTFQDSEHWSYIIHHIHHIHHIHQYANRHIYNLRFLRCPKGISLGAKMPACQLNMSSPTGPAEQFAGGSLPKSYKTARLLARHRLGMGEEMSRVYVGIPRSKIQYHSFVTCIFIENLGQSLIQVSLFISYKEIPGICI